MLTKFAQGVAASLKPLVVALALMAGSAQAAVLATLTPGDDVFFNSGNLAYGVNCSGAACADVIVSQYGTNGISFGRAADAPLLVDDTFNLYITVQALSGTIGSWSGLLVNSIGASMGGNLIFPAPNENENAFLFLSSEGPQGTVSFENFAAPVTSFTIDNFDLLAYEGTILRLIFAPTLVPEPASLAAFATALAGLGLFARRRARREAQA